MIHFLLLAMTSAAPALHFSFHLYMTLCNFVTSQIVFRLIVSSDLWEIHCPGLETNMGFDENINFFVISISLHTFYCCLMFSSSVWRKYLDAIGY